MKKQRKPCMRTECLITNGERIYYQKQLQELQTKYDALFEDSNFFKSYVYLTTKMIKEQRY